MSYISKINIEGVDYDVRDKVLEHDVTQLSQRMTDIEGGAAGGDSVLVAEDGFFFTDAQGYVGVKIDATGLHAINLVEIE